MPFTVSHFEVAKKLEIDSIDFHVGNLLPDINHWTNLLSKEQTHFITYEPVRVYGNIDLFVERNIKYKNLDEKSYNFTLGHLTHIITDRTWGELFYLPVFSRYKDQKEQKRRYFAIQWKLLNSIFKAWDETPEIRDEFLSLKKYTFSEITTLPYPFGEINVKKLRPLLETIIDLQFSVKQKFDFSFDELCKYEKELKRYIPEDYYERFLDAAVQNIQDVFERYELKI